MKKKITAHDIKQALLDERFRRSLPDELQDEVASFLKNPGCGSCNHKIYMNIMRKAPKQVAEYYPSKEKIENDDVNKEIQSLSKNQWQVINCSIHELSNELKKLGSGRKQIAVTRWEDQVTVVVNHLDFVY